MVLVVTASHSMEAHTRHHLLAIIGMIITHTTETKAEAVVVNITETKVAVVVNITETRAVVVNGEAVVVVNGEVVVVVKEEVE